MYSLTTVEGVALALALTATATALVLGVLRWFPRSIEGLVAGGQCPLIGRQATLELARDEWTRRLIDVTCCSVLGVPGAGLCRKNCLLAVARSPRFRRS